MNFTSASLGGRDDNFLSGLKGKGTLVSGTGEDVFVFESAVVSDLFDRITDMDITRDLIELASSVFTAISPGKLAGTAFRAHPARGAFNASDRLIYETDTWLLSYDPDGSGATAAVVFVQLQSNLALTASDFDIV